MSVLLKLVKYLKIGRGFVFINKVKEGNNIAGSTIARLRKEMNISQRQLAEKMQLVGIDIDKNAIQRIEARKRFITDIELCSFATVFGVSVDSLVKNPEYLFRRS